LNSVNDVPGFDQVMYCPAGAEATDLKRVPDYSCRLGISQHQAQLYPYDQGYFKGYFGSWNCQYNAVDVDRPFANHVHYNARVVSDVTACPSGQIVHDTGAVGYEETVQSPSAYLDPGCDGYTCSKCFSLDVTTTDEAERQAGAAVRR
jgi:hypothetical protein